MADDYFRATARKLLVTPEAERDAELAKMPERLRVQVEMEMHAVRNTPQADLQSITARNNAKR